MTPATLRNALLGMFVWALALCSSIVLTVYGFYSTTELYYGFIRPYRPWLFWTGIVSSLSPFLFLIIGWRFSSIPKIRLLTWLAVLILVNHAHFFILALHVFTLLTWDTEVFLVSIAGMFLLYGDGAFFMLRKIDHPLGLMFVPPIAAFDRFLFAAFSSVGPSGWIVSDGLLRDAWVAMLLGLVGGISALIIYPGRQGVRLLVVDVFPVLTGELLISGATLGRRRPRWDLYRDRFPIAFDAPRVLSFWIGTAFWATVIVLLYVRFGP